MLYELENASWKVIVPIFRALSLVVVGSQRDVYLQVGCARGTELRTTIYKYDPVDRGFTMAAEFGGLSRLPIRFICEL